MIKNLAKPGFGVWVRSWAGSKFGERMWPNPRSEFGSGERNRLNPDLAGSKFGERNRPNPGLALTFLQTRNLPWNLPFSEL